MKFLRFYILYRLPIAIALLVGGYFLYKDVDKITGVLCYIAGFISLVLYFTFGPMRLIQEAAEEGDIEKAKRYLNSIKFPRLLFKPFRSAYYAFQSNFALAEGNLDQAEANIRKGLNTKSSLADMTGSNLMQLGFIQLKKGNTKEARKYLMDAVKAGIPDKEALAATYLQLCNIEIQRHQNKIGKEYFRKAKALKPTSEELVKQIKMLEKQISRLPG
jgi:tetratricopeptide (TPR) repeat protein